MGRMNMDTDTLLPIRRDRFYFYSMNLQRCDGSPSKENNAGDVLFWDPVDRGLRKK